MIYSRLALTLTAAVALMPASAAAVRITDTLNLINTVINALIPIIISLAIVVFFWGLVQYLLTLGDESKRNEGIKIMIWGVVAIFVMVSIWGIIRLLQSTFQVTNRDPLVPRAIQIQDSLR